MKVIGKRVHAIYTSPLNPRNGEMSLIRLKDGAILCAYTQYYTEDSDDHGAARLMACLSRDEGETWSESFVLRDKDPAAQNYMSPTLLRLKSGALGMLWLRKEAAADGMLCMPVFSVSEDEGKSWSPYVFCASVPGYYCGTNDSAVVLRSGRIMVPISLVGAVCGSHAGVVIFLCSDDNGQTWFALPTNIASPYQDEVGLQEPGVYEQRDGTLWAHFRTAYGFQYHSLSRDGGLTWTPAAPNFRFTSPDAPMRVKKAGDFVVAVFNPVGHSIASRWPGENWSSPHRSPFACAVSRNDADSFIEPGKTFACSGFREFDQSVFLLEDDPDNNYCYPAICPVEGGFLVGYYHTNGTRRYLNISVIKKVLFSELQPE